MSDLNNSLYYTKRATEARRSAEVARDGSIRAIHFETAKRYDGLADAVHNDDVEPARQAHIERGFGSITSLRRKSDIADHDAIALMVTDALPQMIWSTLPDGYHDYYNAQWYEFTGVDPGTTDGDGWNGMFHADDQKTSWARWQHCLATGEPYEVDYRLRRKDGEYRWMLGRALPMHGKSGAIIRWVGTCTDIHDAHLLADQNDLLSKEMHHRIANVFAVVGSLLALEARDAPSASALAASMQGRLSALNAAHLLAQPSSATGRNAKATVLAIIRQVIKPYENSSEPRFVFSGADTPVDDTVITAIALLIHELCTNAVKYGALANEHGTISITTRKTDQSFAIQWVERGGNVVLQPPVGTGFGTVLTTLTVEQQMGGTIVRDWKPEGLEVNIVLAMAKVHHASVIEAPA
jgi:PAS domain S-box-containing protein